VYEKFVPRYYQMDPLSEDLLWDGSELKDGYQVLVGDAEFRVDIVDDVPANVYDQAMVRNRWCTISRLFYGPDHVTFMAVYEDGSKRKVTFAGSIPWLVKLNSKLLAHSQGTHSTTGETRMLPKVV
jgi:hypothetical protein